MGNDDTQSEPPTLNELMASVGFLLLRWGNLEATLAGKPAPDELHGVRQMRNDLCHGLRSARADPTEEAEPHLRCESEQRGSVIYSWSEIQAAIRSLEGFR
jgi:hypothetical protein